MRSASSSVWLIFCHGAVGAWFTGATGQDKLAAAILFGIFSWRLLRLLFRIVLQPDLPNARLCDVRDPDARAMYIRISLVMLLIILGRILGQVLIAIRTPPEAVGYQTIAVVVYFSAFIWLVVRSREAPASGWAASARWRRWPASSSRQLDSRRDVLLRRLGRDPGLRRRLGTGTVYVASTMLLTLDLVVGVVVFETLLQAFVRRLDSRARRTHPGERRPEAARRRGPLCARRRAIGVRDDRRELGRITKFRSGERKRDGIRSPVRRAPPASPCSWPSSIWELFKTPPIRTWSARPRCCRGDRRRRCGRTAGVAAQHHDAVAAMAMVIVIAVIAVLVALQDFGVNITPLIAGPRSSGISPSRSAARPW